MSDNIGVGDYQGLSESYKEDIDKLRKENEELKVTLLKNIGTFEDLNKALKTAEEALDHLNYYKKCTCKDLKKVAAELPCQYCTCTKTLEVIKNLREGEE